MNIKHVQQGSTTFDDLDLLDAFSFLGRCYIKIHHSHTEMNAISLDLCRSNRTRMHIMGDSRVAKMNSELIINHPS